MDLLWIFLDGLAPNGFSSVVAMARPAPAPVLGVADPAAAHLGLASQIYAWMAQAGKRAARNSKDM